MRGTAAVALAVLLAACGNKGRPLAPELVRPMPPSNLVATATPEGVRLTWSRPTSYRGGKRMNDLGQFEIERAPGDGSPVHYAVLHRMELTDQERFRQERRMVWTDKSAEKDQRYLYRVRAITTDNYRSTWAGPVALTVHAGEKAAAPPPRKRKKKAPPEPADEEEDDEDTDWGW